MPMPTNPFKLPVQKNTTVARIATEGSALTGKNFGTDTIDFDATKLGEFYPLSEEMNEDSAPAILQIARAEVAEAQIRARETVALNGDTTGPHMDLDVVDADDARKLAKGLRKLALENTANGSVIDFGGPVTTAKLDEMRTAMGKFGIGVRNMAYVFSPTTYNQAVSLDEVTSVEKFGGQATIITGALAAFRGIPVIISEFIREDVDANGVHTAVPAADTKGLVHLVNLQRFWYGIRRPIQVRVQLDLPNQDRFLLASYSRIDFKGHEQSADEVSSVLGVNVTI
jgi:HK97 family phage major capsid protein